MKHLLYAVFVALGLYLLGTGVVRAEMFPPDTWINSVSGDGSVITMADGTVWLVEQLHRIDSMLWLPVDDIAYLENTPKWGCMDARSYVLLNPDEDEYVCARMVR